MPNLPQKPSTPCAAFVDQVPPSRALQSKTKYIFRMRGKRTKCPKYAPCLNFDFGPGKAAVATSGGTE